MAPVRYCLLALAVGLLLVGACAGPQPPPTATARLDAAPTSVSTASPTPTPIGADARTELLNVQAAVTALKLDNRLTGIPNPVGANEAPCTVGTKDMRAFPDVTSDAANGGKVKDPGGNRYTFPGDKPGYVLFGHDIHADGAQSGLVNYIVWPTAIYCYTVNELGAVSQVPETGPSLEPASPAVIATSVPEATVAPTAPGVAAAGPTTTLVPEVTAVCATPTLTVASRQTPTPTAAATGTPTATPDPSGLVFTITIVPSEPLVGDMVRVTAYASGSGGLPQYKLLIATESTQWWEPSGILSLESPYAVSVSQLGVPVSFDLCALQAGEATLQVSVNYEKGFCVPTHCVYQFTNASSDLVRVSVRDGLR